MKPYHQKFIQLLAFGLPPETAYRRAVGPDTPRIECERHAEKLMKRFTTEIEEERKNQKLFDKAMLATQLLETYPEKIFNPKHAHFVELIAAGGGRSESYRLAISEKANPKCANAGAGKLVKLYAAEIDYLIRERAFLRMSVRRSQALQEELKKVLAEAEVDARLSAIIKGQCGLNGDPNTKPTYVEMLKAIDMYYYRFGSYADKPEGPQFTNRSTLVHINKSIKA